MTSEQNLPAVDSVWGKPSIAYAFQWRRILDVSDDRIIASRWSGHKMKFSMQEWSEFIKAGAVDITALGESDKYEYELAECEKIVQQVHPMGDVMGIGLLNVATALREIFADQLNADLDQPFTVDWLVEIGAVLLREAGPYGAAFVGWEDDIGWLLAFDSLFTWTFRGESIGEKPITTRRDVMKWLDVLGVEPTTKGGAT